MLYCLSEKLRGSGKLDEADENFLHEVMAGGLYEAFPESNEEKLELFINALTENY